jgi:hypothetical protein
MPGTSQGMTSSATPHGAFMNTGEFLAATAARWKML